MSRQVENGAREREGREGIVGLLRETAEGLSSLVADHIRLARVELTADARAYGRGLGVLLTAVLILVLGYGMAWIAVALALAQIWNAPIAFGAVAALHLLAGGVAVSWAAGKMKRTRLMHDSAAEATRSVDALTKPLQRSAS